MKKVLNLYAGIGGNRAKWPADIEVVAIEINPDIAKFYQERFTKDRVLVRDAHQYLLEYYMIYDFIWSSIPCPSHSDIRRANVHHGQSKAVYPDMKLYEEIILLQNFAPLGTRWVVENVKPYYDLLIPGKQIDRHIFWSNFPIPYQEIEGGSVPHDITGKTEVYGVTLPKSFPMRKDKVLRNMVNPELGLYIFNIAAGIKDTKSIQVGMDLEIPEIRTE